MTLKPKSNKIIQDGHIAVAIRLKCFERSVRQEKHHINASPHIHCETTHWFVDSTFLSPSFSFMDGTILLFLDSEVT